MPSLSCCQGQRGSQRRTLTCNWAVTVGQFTDSASWAALPLPSSQSWALVPCHLTAPPNNNYNPPL